MKKICYVFIRGRKEKYLANSYEAKEFYYGLHHLEEASDTTVEIIEFSNSDNFFSLILRFIDKVFSKFFSIPAYSHRVVSIKNLKTLLKSDKVVLVSESTGYSALLMLIFLKFTKIQVTLFVMGLYSKKLRFSSLKKIHNLLIKLLVFFIDDVLILGQGEYRKALNLHKNISKIHYFPFCVDTKFWSMPKSKNILKNSEILFIGNDGNRDFELVVNIAEKMKHFKFRFISENETITKVRLPNVIVEKGKWGSTEITDEDLKEYYLQSRMVILPLKDSTQPSGQSVSLQAMSLGVPVLISDTDGFWDRDKFIHNDNIYLVKPNGVTNWIESIEEMYNNRELMSNLSINGKNIIDKEFSLKNFHSQLVSILNI